MLHSNNYYAHIVFAELITLSKKINFIKKARKISLLIKIWFFFNYSTVTDFARFLG